MRWPSSWQSESNPLCGGLPSGPDRAGSGSAPDGSGLGSACAGAPGSGTSRPSRPAGRRRSNACTCGSLRLKSVGDGKPPPSPSLTTRQYICSSSVVAPAIHSSSAAWRVPAQRASRTRAGHLAVIPLPQSHARHQVFHPAYGFSIALLPRKHHLGADGGHVHQQRQIANALGIAAQPFI